MICLGVNGFSTSILMETPKISDAEKEWGLRQYPEITPTLHH